MYTSVARLDCPIDAKAKLQILLKSSHSTEGDRVLQAVTLIDVADTEPASSVARIGIGWSRSSAEGVMLCFILFQVNINSCKYLETWAYSGLGSWRNPQNKRKFRAISNCHWYRYLEIVGKLNSPQIYYVFEFLHTEIYFLGSLRGESLNMVIENGRHASTPPSKFPGTGPGGSFSYPRILMVLGILFQEILSWLPPPPKIIAPGGRSVLTACVWVASRWATPPQKTPCETRWSSFSLSGGKS